MADVLVIGNGYLGSYLLDLLRIAGHRAEVACKSGDGNGVFEADVSDGASVRSLAEKIDFDPKRIVHCASSGRGGADAYEGVFVRGVKNITAAFPDTTCILTSSTSVYAQIDGSVVTEESPANPDRETGKYLREAEDMLLERAGVVLRLAGIYGPNRAIHVKKMLEGTATIESGEVSRWLNQIHRNDAADAIRHIIESDIQGEVFNVSDDDPISQKDCYHKLASILDRPIPPELAPDMNRKRAWTNKKVSNSKLKSTGWNPNFPSFVQAIENDSTRMGYLH